MAKFSDDVAALKAQADAVVAAHHAALDQLTTALFTRLKPLPALDWMTDAQLQTACSAFASTAITQVVPPVAPGALL